jgi:hypothetical protein
VGTDEARRAQAGGLFVAPEPLFPQGVLLPTKLMPGNARCVMPFLFWMVLPLALWDAFTPPASKRDET